MKGKIVRAIAGYYYIYGYEDGRTHQCRARGIFRKNGEKPLVGDEVVFDLTHTEDTEGTVDSILPRKNYLIRPPVANVDQALIVFALKDPAPNLSLLDRFLILMEKQQIPAVIVFNKDDLDSEKSYETIRRIYSGCGCRILSMSIRSGEGVGEVRKLFEGKTTVLSGPSGVGKSSLTNLLCPEAGMEVGEVSRQTRRGKQTTRHAQLFPCGDGAFFFDTPGFSSLYLDGIRPQELKDYFPEFKKYEPQCRFQGCLHLAEPDCAVKSAVQEGKISRERYDSYRKLKEELETGQKEGRR